MKLFELGNVRVSDFVTFLVARNHVHCPIGRDIITVERRTQIFRVSTFELKILYRVLYCSFSNDAAPSPPNACWR